MNKRTKNQRYIEKEKMGENAKMQKKAQLEEKQPKKMKLVNLFKFPRQRMID